MKENKKAIIILGLILVGMVLVAVLDNVSSQNDSNSDDNYAEYEEENGDYGNDLSGFYDSTYASATYDGGTFNGPSPDYDRISLEIDENRVRFKWYDNLYFGDIYHDSGGYYTISWDSYPRLIKDATYSKTTLSEETEGKIEISLKYNYSGANVSQNIGFKKR